MITISPVKITVKIPEKHQEKLFQKQSILLPGEQQQTSDNRSAGETGEVESLLQPLDQADVNISYSSKTARRFEE